MDTAARLLVERLVPVLRMMDAAQRATDEAGQREIAWYCFRGEVEHVLGLAPGALDTSGPLTGAVPGAAEEDGE